MNRREKQQRSEQAKAEPRINVYACEKCHKHTVTVDVAEGVTPFMIGCQNDETECRGTATSSFYPRGPKPARIPEPQFEWYKPTDAELATQKESIVDYVKNGGLLLRKRTDATPMLHELVATK